MAGSALREQAHGARSYHVAPGRRAHRDALGVTQDAVRQRIERARDAHCAAL
jgi:hypothetical protein